MKIIPYNKYDGRKYFLTRHISLEMNRQGFIYFQINLNNGDRPKTVVRKFIDEYFNNEDRKNIELAIYTDRKGLFKNFIELYIKFNDKN